MLDQLALWLATYALHSTLLLGSAWVLARLFPAASERVWRLALFGGLVTATLHAGGYWPGVAYLELPGFAREGRETQESPDPTVETRVAGSRGVATLAPATDLQDRPARRLASSATVDPAPATTGTLPSSAETADTTDAVAVASSSQAAEPAEGQPAAWWPDVVIAWLVVLAASLAMVAGRAARFHWRFRARRQAERGEARTLLSDLTRRAGFNRPVRLSLAESARVPMARGWLRPEICLPPALENELAPEELEAALAHELAHLERRDPLWRAVTRLLATALPFQPLNRLACRALEDEAELRCDDRAAALTGRPAALARCLTRVASWTAIDRGRTPLPALAARRGTLRRRVMRLLDDRSRRAPSRFIQAVAVVPPALVLTLAPGLGPPHPGPPWARAPHCEVNEPHHQLTLAVGGETESTYPESQRRSGVDVVAPQALTDPVVHRLEVPKFGEAPPESPVAPRPPRALTAPTAPTVPLAAVAFAAPAPLARLGVAPAALAAPAPAAHAPAAPAAPTESTAPASPAPPAEADDEDEEAELEAEADAERLDEVAEEVDRLMEDLDERLETALAVFDDALEQELDAVAEEIDSQVDTFDEEIERSLAPLEEALEELGEELEEATAEGNERRVQMLERQMSEIGGAMGDLGGKLGSLVSRSALTGVDQHLQTVLEKQSETIEAYAQRQAEVGRQLVREIEQRQQSGQRLDDAEIESLASELERIAEEAAPHYEELERQVEEMTRQLEPARAQMRTLSAELRREVVAWRKRHAELLRELEEDGVSVPSYEDEPDHEPETDSEPEESDDPDVIY